MAGETTEGWQSRVRLKQEVTTVSKSSKVTRPKKPYPDYPLTPHTGGMWMKKIRGRIRYFGRWARRENGKLVRLPGDGWKEALEKYREVADDLHAGREPRRLNGALTVGVLRERFLTHKSRALDAGEIKARTYIGYRETADLLIRAFGENRAVQDLGPKDFEGLRAQLASRLGPVRLGVEINLVRGFFKFAVQAGLADRLPAYGPSFTRPSKSVLRRHRAQGPSKMFSPEELRRLIDIADEPLKAMILLGLNAAYGPNDCATLPESALDLDGGWITFARPKTGIARRCKLWPETAGSLQAVIAARPKPSCREARGLVFVRPSGRTWLTARGQSGSISAAVRALMKRAGIYREKVGHYALRHVFRTVADRSRDTPAVNLVMGHASSDMGEHYREHIDDSRLVDVSELVRSWLYGQEGGAV